MSRSWHDDIVNAVMIAKKTGVNFESLALLYKAFSSASSIGPEFIHWPEIVSAITQGLTSEDKGTQRGTE
jgi:hypothetical protein